MNLINRGQIEMMIWKDMQSDENLGNIEWKLKDDQ